MRISQGRVLRAFVILIAVVVALNAQLAQAGDDVTWLQLEGLSVKSTEWAMQVLKRPPRAGSARVEWAEAAAIRLEEAYQREGYTFAQVWAVADETGTDVVFEVDEGRIEQIVLVGADPLRGLALQWTLHLPQMVFEKNAVETQLAAVRERYNLVDVRYEVKSTEGRRLTPRGVAIPLRVLAIYTVGREPYGWKVGVDFSPQWGVLPQVALFGRDWGFEGDRFRGDVGISVPYRQFLFEESPVFRWLHGHIDAEYRFPPFAGIAAPAVRARFDSSVLRRSDLGLATWHRLEALATGGVALVLSPSFSISVVGGVNWVWAGGLVPASDETPVTASASQRIRGVLELSAVTDFGDGALRSDLRDLADIRLRLAISERGELLSDSRMTYRWTEAFSFHDLILSGRVLWLAGDVNFWDEEPLAGSWSRLFLDGRYWVRHALQVQLGMRFGLGTERVKLGLFNDLSFFGDRTAGGERLGFANGSGPSVHLLLFDVISVDLYYALGFDRFGFAHNFAFTAGTVF